MNEILVWSVLQAMLFSQVSLLSPSSHHKGFLSYTSPVRAEKQYLTHLHVLTEKLEEVESYWPLPAYGASPEIKCEVPSVQTHCTLTTGPVGLCSFNFNYEAGV